MAVETRATWGDGWIKGYAAKFADVENQADQAYSLGIESALGVENNKFTRLFVEKTSEKAQERIASKSGTGIPVLTAEGGDFASDSRQPGYMTVFQFIKKTLSVEITLEERNDRENDLEEKFNEARDLKISMMSDYDRTAFSVFNYAFTAQASLPSTVTFYSDGVPLCSTLHPLKAAGGTHSNASATGIPLTETNLEVGRQALRRQVDDRNLPMNIGSGRVILLVPDSLEKVAMTFAKSKLRPSTANNDMNIYDGVVTVISTKWINSQNGGSDTAWFLIDSMKSPFIFWKREDMITSTYLDNKNKNLIHDIYSRWQVGNKTWRGFWGSRGDNAAYSA